MARATTEDELRGLFEGYGEVISAAVIKDRFTGESRGFGFVEMASKEEGEAAIEALNGKEVGGREIVVNVARPRRDNRRGGGGGGRGGYGGGGRGGGDRGRRW